jgi:hypothetical protein
LKSRAHKQGGGGASAAILIFFFFSLFLFAFLSKKKQTIIGVNNEIKACKQQKEEAEKYEQLQEDLTALETKRLLWRLFHLEDDTKDLRKALKGLEKDASKQENERVLFFFFFFFHFLGHLLYIFLKKNLHGGC